MKDFLREIVASQVNLEKLMGEYFPEVKVPNGQAVDSHVIVNGRRFIQLAGQDYLSLTIDPRVIEAAVHAMKEYGIDALGSPVVAGTLDLHIKLQNVLAQFMGADGAVIFTTGMLTNLGSIPAIISSPYQMLARGTNRKSKRAIFPDQKSHTSIQIATDVCKAHGVSVHSYEHASYDDLDRRIKQFGCEYNLVITDGVFSMDGDIAPLGEIVQVAESHSDAGRKTAVYVDDAHGVGVLGENGRGVCELLGVENKVVTMGVLSKAFGTLGGFVTGPKWLTDYLSYSLTHMFSLSLPPAETAASIAAIEIVREEPYRRKKLLANADFLRKSLMEKGFKVLGKGTQIVFVVIGDEDEAKKVSAELEKESILCPAIGFPAVSIGQAGLRLTPTFKHEVSELEEFLTAFFRITHK
jgi:7-keto-8-aminopelargonate synthetase-like enzyme